MWAVYICGCTDCFLHAMFMDESEAYKWAAAHNRNPEGYRVVFFAKPTDIDRTDTGWQVGD